MESCVIKNNHWGIYALKLLKQHPVLLFLLCVAVTGVAEYIIVAIVIPRRPEY